MSVTPLSLIVDGTLSSRQEEPDGSPGHHPSPVSSYQQPPTLFLHGDKTTEATSCEMPSNYASVPPRHVTLALEQSILPGASGQIAILQGGRSLSWKITSAPGAGHWG